MFWDIFLQSSALIAAILIVGNIVAYVITKSGRG
jgi:hypothetical protein